MAELVETGSAPPRGSPLTVVSTSSAGVRFGQFEARANISVTPLALLAIGGLVATILLSIPPIIRAAGEARAQD